MFLYSSLLVKAMFYMASYELQMGANKILSN